MGELVTSLDMAGCSLTVTWLDDELERLWASPADTPAYRKGRAAASAGTPRVRIDHAVNAETVQAADCGARASGRIVAEALSAIAVHMVGAEHDLGRIDAVAGDGDHGRGMVKGTGAAAEAATSAAHQGAGTATVLTAAGQAWAAKAGGTSGVLWGAALAAAADRLGDAGTPDGRDVAEALRAGHDALTRLRQGQARRQDHARRARTVRRIVRSRRRRRNRLADSVVGIG